MHLPLMKI